MKRMGDYFFPLGKKLASATDVSEYAGGAQDAANFAKDIPSLFPPGSDTGRKNRAKPDIWANQAEFKQAAENLSVQATKLAQLATANDKAGFTAQYKVTGDACGSCHTKFRAPAS
ncbi:MAG: cytochrome c [Acidisphaera sp.]|nr:cytochrome c [Acidisphaera sp.]